MSDVPHDPAAEAAVLGSVLLSPTALTDVATGLTGDDFYIPANELVWDAVMALADAGEPVDPITVAGCMQRAGTLARAGGPVHLHRLIADVPAPAAARHYAGIVRDHATRRRIITAATRAAQVAQSMEGTPQALADLALAELSAAARPTSDDTPTLTSQVDEALDAIENHARAGWSWPWVDLRRILVPPAPGQFILVAARPRIGKSVTLIDIARHVALRQGLPVVVHTLEMSATEVIHRIIAAEEKIPLDHIKQNILTEDEWARVAAATKRILDSKLVILDNPSAGVSEVRASIRAYHPVLVLFDYFQLGRTNPAQKDRRQALEEMSRAFKILAKTEQVSIVAAAQLNRKAQERSDKQPVLSDLRETGSLEQDCDTAILIHREDADDPECTRAGEADMIVAKQRNGPQGRAVLIHQLHYSRFVDMAN